MGHPGLIAQPSPGIRDHAASDRYYNPDHAPGLEECFCLRIASQVLLHEIIGLVCRERACASADGPEQILLGGQLDESHDQCL